MTASLALTLIAALQSQAEPITLRGHVRPPEGRETLAEAPLVVLVGEDAREHRSLGAPDGSYSVPGMAPGRYWVSCRTAKDGFARGVVELQGGDEVVTDLWLAFPPVVTVRVTGDSDRASFLAANSCVCVATLEPPGLRWSFEHAVSAAPWTYGIAPRDSTSPSDSPSWRVALDSERPVHVSLVRGGIVVATRRAEPGETIEIAATPDMVLAPCRFRASPIDATTGAPLPFEYSREEELLEQLRPGPPRASARPNRTHFVDVRPGWMMLPGGSHEHERVAGWVWLEPGGEVDVGDYPVERERTVAGRIVDEQDAGTFAELSCELVSAAGTRMHGPLEPESHRSTNDGVFGFRGLSRGTYRLSFAGDDVHGASAIEIDTRERSPEDVRFPLRRGIPLIVSASDEDGTAAVAFEIVDARGVRVLRERMARPEPTKRLLAPGKYRVTVRGAGIEPRTLEIDLTDAPVSLRLP